jgi:hypothetical protein
MELNKERFKLVVSDLETSELEWESELYKEYGYKLGITAYSDTGDMVSEHVSSKFKELENIGINDEIEGFMIYNGAFSRENLINKIKSFGFKAE